MINRIKLALKIMFGKDVIIYDKNTKIIELVINGDKDIFKMDSNLSYVITNAIHDNNNELRYFGRNKENFNRNLVLKALEERDVLQCKLKQRDEAIDVAINDINLVIELIKQQPTENDTWILERLSGFKYILNKYKNVGD